MKRNLSAIQSSVIRNPVACGTGAEYLPCLSESVFVDAVMCASRLSSAGACNVSLFTSPFYAVTKVEFDLDIRYRVLVQNNHRGLATGRFAA
jgi:hypothetical protein